MNEKQTKTPWHAVSLNQTKIEKNPRLSKLQTRDQIIDNNFTNWKYNYNRKKNVEVKKDENTVLYTVALNKHSKEKAL